jgi:hypothetical protein
MHVTRRLDRSGVLDLNGVSPNEAIELITDLPSEVVINGMSKCLELEVFIEDDGRLLMPNFLEAQEAVASNSERQRRWRAKKRSVTSSNDMSTNNNETSTDRNERNVTHNENNAVLNQPCLTNRANLPDSEKPESVSRRIKELESRYGNEIEIIHDAREACALSRKNGKMADSVWLKVLRELAPHDIGVVLEAITRFTERHADGEKNERYLIAIVRGIQKKEGGSFSNQTKIRRLDDCI